MPPPAAPAPVERTGRESGGAGSGGRGTSRRGASGPAGSDAAARAPAPARPAGDSVRWAAPGTVDDPYASGRVTRAPYGAAARTATPPWNTRADAVARWCLSKRPLAPAARALLGPAALAPWIGRTPPDTLGALLRAALGSGEGGLVALYDALADAGSPGSRALLARILGAPFLLVTVRVRQGAVVGADSRACGDEREALGLLAALGANDPGRGALTRGVVIGGPADGESVALLPEDDVSLLADSVADIGDGDALLALPILDLDAGADVEPATASAETIPSAVPPTAGWPQPSAGAGGSGSPFLEAFDPRLRDEPEADATRDAELRVGDDAGRGSEPVAARRGRVLVEGDEKEPEADEDDEPGDDDPSPFLQTSLDGALLAPERDDAAPAVAAEPPPLDAEVSAAALARLSARARAAAERVSATVATDDGVLETVVDIVSWLSEASERELRALIADRWRGEEAAEVARVLAEDDPEVDEVVRQARRTDAELVVEIDGGAAAAWLAHHRPGLAERLGLTPDD